MAGKKGATAEVIAQRQRAILKLIQDGESWGLVMKAITTQYEISERQFRRDIADLGADARLRLEDVDALDVEFLAAIDRLRKRAVAADKAQAWAAANQADFMLIKLLGTRKAATWGAKRVDDPAAQLPQTGAPGEAALLRNAQELHGLEVDELRKRKDDLDRRLGGLKIVTGGRG